MAKEKEKSNAQLLQVKTKMKQSTEFLVLISNKITTFVKAKSLKQRGGKVQLRWESWLGKKGTWKTNENIWWYLNNSKEENNALTKQHIIQQITEVTFKVMVWKKSGSQIVQIRTWFLDFLTVQNSYTI